ncbi:MAG TPA: (2Fe-2S)-binding protein [Aquabacterium sp.]|nr:(2Fe-2S)-binding protein [Aquabacterium sp.]
MIVCVCRRVSDRDITRIARQGCASFDDLQMDTGVATCCGQCESCARDVFHKATQTTVAHCDARPMTADTLAPSII